MTTPASTRPDTPLGHTPADTIVAAFAELRERHADDLALARRMLAGDVEAIAAGRARVGLVSSIDRRIAEMTGGTCIDDCLTVYAICRVLAVSEALDVIDGHEDPRHFTGSFRLTAEEVARWAPSVLRQQMARAKRQLERMEADCAAGVLPWVTPGDLADYRREVAAEVAACERELAELED